VKRIHKALWRVHEAHLPDERTGNVHTKRTDTDDPQSEDILGVLGHEFRHKIREFRKNVVSKYDR
jgi:hypothetical protein